MMPASPNFTIATLMVPVPATAHDIFSPQKPTFAHTLSQLIRSRDRDEFAAAMYEPHQSQPMDVSSQPSSVSVN